MNLSLLIDIKMATIIGPSISSNRENFITSGTDVPPLAPKDSYKTQFLTSGPDVPPLARKDSFKTQFLTSGPDATPQTHK